MCSIQAAPRPCSLLLCSVKKSGAPGCPCKSQPHGSTAHEAAAWSTWSQSTRRKHPLDGLPHLLLGGLLRLGHQLFRLRHPLFCLQGTTPHRQRTSAPVADPRSGCFGFARLLIVWGVATAMFLAVTRPRSTNCLAWFPRFS